MRSLILGGGGSIGSAFTAGCEERQIPHLATYYQNAIRYATPLDVRDADGIRELIDDYQPDSIFYCVPWNVTEGLTFVLDAIREKNIRLVSFTNDGIFGHCRSARQETDALRPDCWMGRRSAEMETQIRETLPDRHLIIRTSLVYDSRLESDWLSRSLRLMTRNKTVFVDNCTVRMPTFAADLVDATLALLRHDETGTFHIVGPDRMTEHRFLQLAAHLFHHDVDLVQPTSVMMDSRAHWLDRHKICSLLGKNVIRGCSEGLRTIRNRARPQPIAA